MKLNKVNAKGSQVKHVVTHAPRASAPNKTFKCRASLEVTGKGIVVYKWRIYEGGDK